MKAQFVRYTIFLAILLTVLFTLPGATAAQRRGVALELGADVYNTLSQANGYQWYAAGYLFPPGTYAKLDDCQRADYTKAIGTYAVYGSSGNPSLHLATYRITIGKESWYFNGEIAALDEHQNPSASLFDNVAYKVNGQFISEDPPTTVTYTPRSTECFGGRLMLFRGQPANPAAEQPGIENQNRQTSEPVIRDRFIFMTPPPFATGFRHVKD